MIKRGLGLIIYGVEGIGKTSFALQFPGPIEVFSIKESGFEDLQSIEETPEHAENFSINDYRSLVTGLRNTQARTVILDSLSGFQQIFVTHIADKDYGGELERLFGWQNQKKVFPQYMGEFELILESLRSRGVNVILIGHSRVENNKNPLGADVQSYHLDMDDTLRASIQKWAQATLFMVQDIATERVVRSGSDRTAMTIKGADNDLRVMHTSKSPCHSAKNRLSLPPTIILKDSAKESFNVFWSKIHKNFKD